MKKHELYNKLQDVIAKGYTNFENNIIKFVPWPLNISTKNYSFKEIYNIETDVQSNINFDKEDFDILAFLEDGGFLKIKDNALKYYIDMVEVYLSTSD